MSRKKKQLGPPIDIASQMLDNVFATCGQEANTVSLDVLISYSNYRKERFIIQRGLIGVVLTLFLLLPILFITATIIITEHHTAGSYNPEYSVNVESPVPVSSISAEIDGHLVTVTETGDKEYLLQPTRNGMMVVTVTLINRQMTTDSVEVVGVDMTQPTLVSTGYDEDFFYLYVSDSESGLDYDAVNAVYESGAVCESIMCDPETGCITIPYPAEPLNIVIPDRGGNALKITLRPQEE